jgi:Transcriptional regulators
LPRSANSRSNGDATLDDVARRARVSTATVSRVLNGSERVRSATRQRVLHAVEELSYTPDLNARSLAGAQTRSIGMIVSNITNPFFLDIFHSVEAGVRQRGHDLIVVNTDYSRDRLAASVTNLLGRRVAGLALVVSETVPRVVSTLGGKLPIVLYDGGGHRLRNVTNIRANYRGGMQRIMEYLYGLGHRRMAFIGHHTDLGPLHERREAFLAVAAEYAPAVKVMTVTSADGMPGGQLAMRQVLDSGFRPTAVACVNDLMAMGALRELHTRGVSVPGEVSVTGFDNISLTEFAVPSLTTADVPRETIGRLICEALMPTGHGPPPGVDVVVETALVVRDSTARPPGRRRRG